MTQDTAATEKSVSIFVPTAARTILKDAGFGLCLARAVNEEFNVVWDSRRGSSFIYETQITWIPEFSVFARETFEDGARITETSNKIRMNLGQTTVFDKNGDFQAPQGGGESNALTIDNQYEAFHFGVNQVRNGKESPFFFQEQNFLQLNME